MTESGAKQEDITVVKIHDFLPCVQFAIAFSYQDQLIEVMKMKWGSKIGLYIFLNQEPEA